jgi:anti-sigma factor ChrR (cupin superfamily)
MKPQVFLSPEDVESMDWEPFPGMPGVWERVLAFDEETGSYTRLIKAAPGFESDEVRAHDFWEESYILEGSFEEDGVVYGPGTFVCNQPGFEHGPYRSETGWLALEICYFPPGMKGNART